MSDLDKTLIAMAESDYYPFHMPGHKRRKLPFLQNNMLSLDWTEVDGLDNLHHAEGILMDAMEHLSLLTGAEKSYFMVNGSTGGILSAFSAALKQGETVLMARNSHKSAYNAVYLNRLKAEYLFPAWISQYELNGGCAPQDVKRALEKNKEIKAVFITSPTYEGIVSDIKAIAEIAHSYNVPLIVDEAHGAHFGLHAAFPKSATTLGADVVIQSFHKTLPALTQTAVLHVNGELVKKELLEKYLSIYQTSSPSYIFMAGIDACVRFLEREGKGEMENYTNRLISLRKAISGLSNIALPGKELKGDNSVFDVDISKIILSLCGKSWTGKKLYDILRKEFHLQCEMYMGSFSLAMTSIMDDIEGYNRLIEALKKIDARIDASENYLPLQKPARVCQTVMSIAEAEEAEKEETFLLDSEGKISAEFLYLYPPGLPLLIPGERITAEHCREIARYQDMEFALLGLFDMSGKIIKTVR